MGTMEGWETRRRNQANRDKTLASGATQAELVARFSAAALAGLLARDRPGEGGNDLTITAMDIGFRMADQFQQRIGRAGS